jgi:hypothetical protein
LRRAPGLTHAASRRSLGIMTSNIDDNPTLRACTYTAVPANAATDAAACASVVGVQVPRSCT